MPDPCNKGPKWKPSPLKQPWWERNAQGTALCLLVKCLKSRSSFFYLLLKKRWFFYTLTPAKLPLLTVQLLANSSAASTDINGGPLSTSLDFSRNLGYFFNNNDESRTSIWPVGFQLRPQLWLFLLEQCISLWLLLTFHSQRQMTVVKHSILSLNHAPSHEAHIN